MAKESSLLDTASSAQDSVHQLAVGLAHAGADPKIVQQLSQMATVLGQVVKALGSGPSLDQSGQDQGAAPPAGGPPQPGPQDAAAGPPQAAAAPPAPSPKQQTAHHAFQAASHALQAAHAAANKK